MIQIIYQQKLLIQKNNLSQIIKHKVNNKEKFQLKTNLRNQPNKKQSKITKIKIINKKVQMINRIRKS